MYKIFLAEYPTRLANFREVAGVSRHLDHDEKVFRRNKFSKRTVFNATCFACVSDSRHFRLYLTYPSRNVSCRMAYINFLMFDPGAFVWYGES